MGAVDTAPFFVHIKSYYAAALFPPKIFIPLGQVY